MKRFLYIKDSMKEEVIDADMVWRVTKRSFDNAIVVCLLGNKDITFTESYGSADDLFKQIKNALGAENVEKYGEEVDARTEDI